jgi:hypothetical protein
MLDTPPNPNETVAEGASCTMRPGGCRAEQAMSGGGLLSGGCCPQNAGPAASHTPIGRAARRSRAAAGLMFLAIAGGLASRRLPGSIALWPASIVPTWFGISHLVAGMTGYQGCPELGAIPSVMLGRPVGTSCELWRRIDRWVESSDADTAPCC